MLASIRLFAGNHATHSSARIFHVPPVARNHVQMYVGNGLPAMLADIDADVIAVRRMAGIEQTLGFVEYGHRS